MSALEPSASCPEMLEETVVLDADAPLRLLVIEDSPTDDALLRALLEDELPHARMDGAPSLEQALSRLSDTAYDLILADLGLPDADGDRVVRALRSAVPHTPLIVLTGRNDRDLALWSLAAGAQDYLVKGEHDGPRLADAILRGLQRSLAEKQTHEGLLSALRLQREAADRLQALDAARRDFVDTANHELRTPLTCIAAYAQLLQDVAGLDSTQAGFVDAIVRNAARLKALIDDLLLLSSLSAEQPQALTDAVDLTELLVANREGLIRMAAGRGVTLTYRLPDRPLPVRGDAPLLERVLLNLLTNAIKFTPTPGTIRCELRATDDDVVLSVTDTGIGIPRDELPLVFDKFFRGAWAHQHAVQGTGLGLHITASIVERHSGVISVDSGGQGTTFTVTLPRLAPSPAHQAEPVEEPLTARLLRLLGLPTCDAEAADIAAMLEAAAHSARLTDQWQLLGDALRFACTRFRARGWGGHAPDQVAAALVEAARGTTRSEDGSPLLSASHLAAVSRTGDEVAPRLGATAASYLDRLLAGDGPGAMQVARASLHEGTSGPDVLRDVLAPAQREVGRRWEGGALSVAEEHFCTTVTRLVAAELYSPAPDGPASGRRLVAMCAPGSQHQLGLRFVTDMLEGHGWAATHAAPCTDEAGLLGLLHQHSAELLLVSASMPDQVRPVRSLIRAVRADPRASGVKVVVGGRLFDTSPELAEVVGADAYARDAHSALEVCLKLTGVES